jgi:RimJ/RimL family protein N-acetyltransferase
MAIQTARLELDPCTPAHYLALLESVDAFEKAAGRRAADGLRDFYVSGEVSPAWLEKLRTAVAADVWVHGFGIVHRESGWIIGCAGFKGPPDESGLVEIGYGIAPGFQGQGYATEAALALVEFAFADSRVRLVRAHTRPGPNASTRVLAKCGFKSVGEVTDPEDGLVWRFERSRLQ